jgi:hypothetical protein
LGDESEGRLYTEDALGKIGTRIQHSSRKSLGCLEQEIGFLSFKFTLIPKINSARETCAFNDREQFQNLFELGLVSFVIVRL